MLNNFNILIMGGDARFLVVIDELLDKGANVFLIGYDKLTFKQEGVINSTLDTIDFSTIDAITLPVSGTDQDGNIEAVYSDKKVFISEEIISKTPNHCVIYTGTSNEYLKKLANSNHRQLVTLFDRDDLAIYNSIPTAEGTLRLAIEQTDVTIHGSNIIVLGFGRVGMSVARLFANVGANVSVAARKSTDIARITEMGLYPVHLSDIGKALFSADICINTIPYLVLDSSTLSTMNKSTLIIDITSAPGGTDFKSAQEHGIKALHALGLPGKTAPKTAGKVIGRVLLELMEEQNKVS